MKYFTLIGNMIMFIIALYININDFSNNDIKNKSDILNTIFHDNKEFVNSHKRNYFENFIKKQTPKAIVVACSDSRFQTDSILKDSTNELFVIRNIGNQFENAQGSIEYGVYHLKIPVLMFIGHSNCGAIESVMSKKKDIKLNLEQDILRELQDMIDRKNGSNAANPHDYQEIDPKIGLNNNVVRNIMNQALDARWFFADLVDSRKLIICGAMYDFSNSLGNGYGKLTSIVVYGNLV